MNVVPPSTAVRRGRVQNVDTDRLLARQDFLHDMLLAQHGWMLDSRNDFAMRALELQAVERELVRRGVQTREDVNALRHASESLSL